MSKYPLNTQEVEKTNAGPFFLSDVPASEDYFGSTIELRPALAEMINKEKGGRSVALEGEWVRVRRPVINLLKSKLESSDKCTIAAFDAWAHEGDPLSSHVYRKPSRATHPCEMIDEQNWNRRLDELAQKLEVKRN